MVECQGGLTATPSCHVPVQDTGGSRVVKLKHLIWYSIHLLIRKSISWNPVGELVQAFCRYCKRMITVIVGASSEDTFRSLDFNQAFDHNICQIEIAINDFHYLQSAFLPSSGIWEPLQWPPVSVYCPYLTSLGVSFNLFTCMRRYQVGEQCWLNHCSFVPIQIEWPTYNRHL